MINNKPDDILDFWYSEPMNKHWFNASPEIDQLIRNKYEAPWRTALKGGYDEWKNNSKACLALIILLDQLPLNMFRGNAESFASEARAIELSLFGIGKSYDKELPVSQLSFFYMPLMHSENLEHQQLCVSKFEQAGLSSNAEFAKHHRDIIKQFGRFPHRNEILRRKSTGAELEYLYSDGSFKG